MRVGISGYVGNRLTGIGRVLVCVVRELSKANPSDEYVLFKNFDFEGFGALEGLENVRIVDFGVSKESGVRNILWHQFGFQKMLRKYGCDIAYIPNFSLLLRKVIPTAVTIHDLIEFNVPGKFGALRMFYRKHICDPLMARRSDAVMTVSESSRRDIVKYLGTPREKVTVTPNAADTSIFHPYPAAQVGETAERYGLTYKKYLIFVGTIDYPGKNIKAVVDSYLDLRSREELEDVKLLIIGKKGYNAQVIMDAVDSSEFREDIVLPGYVPDEDLGKLCAGARIMMYLSHYEGFGLPVLEAMSCGTPAICPNTSCFPEIAGDLDICVPPDDLEKIEEKILSLFDDEVYKELSEAVVTRAADFSWSKSARIYRKVFDSLI